MNASSPRKHRGASRYALLPCLLPSLGIIAACLHAHAADTSAYPAHEMAFPPALRVYEPWPWYGPYAGYWYSPCYPFASCAAWVQYRLLDRRLLRELELRLGPRPVAPVPALPAGPLAPESELQPAYRDSGKVRPEFADSGQWRRELLEERERGDR